MSKLVIVGGIPMLSLTRRDLALRMAEDCSLARKGELERPKVIVASNGAVIAAFHRDETFRADVLQADGVDADGMPLVFASRLFCKIPLPERVATTDFILEASEIAAKSGIKFYFLGARDGVAELAARNLRALYPDLQIVGIRHGYFERGEEAAICDEIVRSGADVLWLGLGSPLQERFAIENRERLKGLAWIRTCGGMFDHWSGLFTRAPRWVQSIGLEWVFRAIQEPVRLGTRYIKTNPAALYHLLTKTRDRRRVDRLQDSLPAPTPLGTALDNAPQRDISRKGSEADPAAKRLMLIASTGGHWVQLSRLAAAFEGHEAHYVTTATGHDAPSGLDSVSVVPDASRSDPLKLFGLVFQLGWLILRFRPHVIISTGAAPGLLALRIGKFLGARTVWIDSLANSEELSLSGRLAENCADLWLTQWDHLPNKYPNLQFHGSVL
jgi:N-acetylglucosaminyldiphosphoundecaprenol N-acetyl-beta-D-mannosaminyltransferase